MAKTTKMDEREERFEAAVTAIDEALDSDDVNVALQGAIAWALVDISDSLDVLAQSVEGKHADLTTPTRRPSKAKKAVRRRERKGADEEDE